jgi:hypothetical protein
MAGSALEVAGPTAARPSTPARCHDACNRELPQTVRRPCRDGACRFSAPAGGQGTLRRGAVRCGAQNIPFCADQPAPAGHAAAAQIDRRFALTSSVTNGGTSAVRRRSSTASRCASAAWPSRVKCGPAQAALREAQGSLTRMMPRIAIGPSRLRRSRPWFSWERRHDVQVGRLARPDRGRSPPLCPGPVTQWNVRRVRGV